MLHFAPFKAALLPSKEGYSNSPPSVWQYDIYLYEQQRIVENLSYDMFPGFLYVFTHNS